MMQHTIKIEPVATNIDKQGLSGFETWIYGIGQAGQSLMLGLSALVGIWGIVCLASGLSHAGGFMDLCRNWFIAVNGM